MANTSALKDLAQSEALRKIAKSCATAAAREAFNLAAERLETRAAKKVRKVGKKAKRNNSVSGNYSR